MCAFLSKKHERFRSSGADVYDFAKEKLFTKRKKCDRIYRLAGFTDRGFGRFVFLEDLDQPSTNSAKSGKAKRYFLKRIHSDSTKTGVLNIRIVYPETSSTVKANRQAPRVFSISPRI